ncbi:vicilin-like seed storage protein At2g18540 [Nilaparvata lugens]|uniref:vicilin-like seed storage protein At2g18540 n=1 Tax=Nilaparvata lugens TaxID=108931 RepID=UPI00193DAFD6|nr:vicilin-like seed storage protein At2g18540 [Nilaparvata lugens]
MWPDSGLVPMKNRQLPPRPRPKSACSVREREHQRRPKNRPRCRSALGLRRYEDSKALREGPSRKTPSPTDSNKTSVTHYKRSLRLLGLLPNEFGSEHSRQHVKPQTQSVKPRVQTFLEKRTISHVDVRDAVLQEIEGDLKPANLRLCDEMKAMQGRHVIAKAVYEEWYFRKLEADRKLRQQAMMQKKIGQWEDQHTKRVKSEVCQEKFDEWVQKKSQQLKQERLKNNSKQKQANVRPVTPQRCSEAFLSWKQEKDKSMQQRALMAKQRAQELERREERKQEAEKAYQMWRKNADEKLKAKQQEFERKKKEQTENEKRLAEEKQREANASFRAWKEKKDKVRQIKLKEAREREERALALRSQMRMERLYESHQAFLEWLDSIDGREAKYNIRRTNQNPASMPRANSVQEIRQKELYHSVHRHLLRGAS